MLTKHPAALLGALVIALLIPILGCDCSSSSNSEDKTPPTIVSLSPAPGATDVPVHFAVEVVFDEDIDLASVDASTFHVVDTDYVVSGTWSADSNTAQFAVSTSVYLYSTELEAWVGGVKDKAGNVLAHDTVWTFTVEPDPSTVPPEVESTVPSNGAVDVAADAAITITFDKDMNPASFTAGSITVSGVSGTISYTSRVATFTPDDTLEYLTEYNVTVDTVVEDVDGFKLESQFGFSFTTEADPMIPLAAIQSPEYDNVVGDSFTVEIWTSHPVGVARVEFFVDGQHLAAGDDTAEPFEYTIDASDWDIGSVYEISAAAYDADERVGYSDTIEVIYLWKEMTAAVDQNDSWETDIRRGYYRCTDSILEFRWEMWEDWYNPYDTFLDDTTLDMGMYLDTDFSDLTGRTYFGVDEPGFELNGIGGDYTLLVGIHGNEALNVYNQGSDGFTNVYDVTGLHYLDWPPDTNIYQVAIEWSDIGNPSGLRLVAINVFWVSQEPASFVDDWYPNKGTSYITITRENQYIGPAYEPSEAARRPNWSEVDRVNPFNTAADMRR